MSRCRLLITLLFALSACGTVEPQEQPGAARTLESCETSIAGDAPEFFKRYFKCVTVTAGGGKVTVTSNGLPPHPSAYYEEDHANWVAFDTSRGAEYRQNPNRLKEQRLAFVIPDSPTARGLTVTAALVDGQVRTSDHEYAMGAAGMALDGVALFNPLAAPGDDIANERFTFDAYNAHPSPDGMYHYHSTSPGPLEVLQKQGLVTKTTPGAAELELYGIMCDGTVVLGCTELDGSAPAASGLDAQGGHVHDLIAKDGVTLWAARYHTHLCVGRHAFEYTPEIQYYATCQK